MRRVGHAPDSEHGNFDDPLDALGQVDEEAVRGWRGGPVGYPLEPVQVGPGDDAQVVHLARGFQPAGDLLGVR